jgi:trypsin
MTQRRLTPCFDYPSLTQETIGGNLLIGLVTRIILAAIVLTSFAAAQQVGETTTNGTHQFRPRIVGGVDVLTPAPYVAMLIYQGTNSRYYGCAGTLISSDRVITAGHCVDDRVPVEIILGRTRITDTEGGEVHSIASIAIHPRYSVRTLENDLAIITLDSPSAFSPLPVATRSMLDSLTYDSELTVQGWGYTDPNFLYPSNVLKQAIVRYIPRYVCNSSLFYDKLIGPGMICAGYVEGGTDSCGGDSGGPLTLKVQQGQYLMGTVSWGASDSCGQAHRPGVYTNLTYYQTWIQQEVYEKASLPNLLRYAPKRATTIGIGDLDGDGVKELISINGNKINISSGKTTSTTILRLKTRQLGRTASRFDLVDVNGDFRDDIVITTGHSMQIYSLKDAISLWSPSKFNTRHSFIRRKIVLPRSAPVVDLRWGRILNPDKAQLAILTTSSFMVLAIDFTQTKVEFTTNIKGGKSLLVGAVEGAPVESVFVFNGSTFKNVFLAGGTGLTISSGQTVIGAPQETFFYDVDGDGINELLSITPSGEKSSLISVARFDGISFGKFSPWFEVPRGSVLAI